jgi:Domain of unknown function (DUF4114)/PEP-CTERM motif
MKISQLNSRLTALVIGAGVTFGASYAQAGVIPYPNPGTQNPVLYSFTATATGPITAYFAGGSAADTEVVGLLVNGVSTGITGLNNQTSSIGQSLVLGNVHAGDILTFVDIIQQPPSAVNTWFSNKAMNSDGLQHIYSTSATAAQISALIPAGTYVGFEDQTPANASDFDYNDVTFVFTNTSMTSGVPEPSTWAMMLLGFAGLGFAFRQSRRKVSFA